MNMVEKKNSHYQFEEVVQFSNKILKLSEEEKVDAAIMLHSLIFTEEYLIKNLGFIPKQIADIRRNTKRLLQSIDKQ